MTQYQFAIVALLSAQAFTLTLLWQTKDELNWYRKAWLRDTTEMLDFKRERNNG
jgi:hypothetical protein